MVEKGKPQTIINSVQGKYLYCIISENKEKGLGYIEREIRLISYKDISAVVSPTPVINFDRLAQKELTRHITAHQQVNEKMMKDYDVVPMTFGIIAPSVDEVLRILEKAYLQFKTALQNIAGKAEFVVHVWWNPQKILEELANTNLEIQKLKQELASKGTILGMPIKLKLGKLIAQKMEQKRQTFINDIHDSLKNLSHDSTLNKLIEEEMIANLSFLIEKTKEPELDKKMQELGKKYEERLRFKYIGPMPLYSFANINLGLGNFELINEARKLLGLGEEATFDEIKKAYYELSHQYHPDKHSGDPKKEEQMKKIAQAHRILKNYCESCDELLGQKTPHQSPEGEQAPLEVSGLDKKHGENRPLTGQASYGAGKHGTGQGQKYSFKKEDVENSIIIK